MHTVIDTLLLDARSSFGAELRKMSNESEDSCPETWNGSVPALIGQLPRYERIGTIHRVASSTIRSSTCHMVPSRWVAFQGMPQFEVVVAFVISLMVTVRSRRDRPTLMLHMWLPDIKQMKHEHRPGKADGERLCTL